MAKSEWDQFAPAEGGSWDQFQAVETRKAEAPKAEPPKEAPKQRSLVAELARQVGLTGRHAIEGVGQAADVFTEPVAILMRKGGIPTASASSMARRLADEVGLPAPENRTERLVAGATRTGFGAAAPAAAAGRLAQGATGMTQAGLSGLAAAPAAQIAGGAGSGVASEAVKEAGGGALAQLGAALAGGLAGGAAGQRAFNTVGRAVEPVAVAAGAEPMPARVTARSPDDALAAVVRTKITAGGGDWDQIPARVKASLLEDVRRSGDIENVSPEALRRLADIRMTGATPTRGAITLDPVQITREKNLAKAGANSRSGELQGLARTENANNQAFLRNLDNIGATGGPDSFQAGQSVIGRIREMDDALGNNVTQLYRTARDMPGGDVPLDRQAFVNAIYDRLARENKLAYLPDNIGNMLNTISTGQVSRGGQTFDVPFNANVLDNIMTDIATAQRGTQDGNVRAALRMAREAIDSVPINPVKAPLGSGREVVDAAGAQTLRNADASAGDFMNALNTARGAARERFRWQESSRPVEAALNDMEPDKFIDKFVMRGNVADAEAVSRLAGGAPGPAGREVAVRSGNVTQPNSQLREAVRSSILQDFKRAATAGADNETARFSAANFRKALDNFGDRKLELFFSPDEIASLRALSRASTYATTQPVGSAVNNSNSGALLVGKGLDLLNGIAGKVPLLNLDQQVDVLVKGAQARDALNVRGALAPRQPVRGQAARGAIVGGLLSLPASAEERQ